MASTTFIAVSLSKRVNHRGLYGDPKGRHNRWMLRRKISGEFFRKRLIFYLNLRLKMEHLSLDLRQCRGRWWMDRHVGKNQPLLVVALAQDFVLAQEKFVAHAESGIEQVND